MKTSCIKWRNCFINELMAIVMVIGLASCNLLNVSQSLLDRLHNYQYISIDFNADINSNNSVISFSMLSVDNTPPLSSSKKCPIEWNGTDFTAKIDYDYKLYSGEEVHYYGTISGKLSDDGKVMETLTADLTSFYPGSLDVYKYFISTIDVPYQADYEYDEYSPRFAAEGQDVSQHIYSYSQSWEYIYEGSQQTIYATTVNYNNPDDVPYLHITFSGKK